MLRANELPLFDAPKPEPLRPVAPYDAPAHAADRGVTLVCAKCGNPYRVQRDRPNRRKEPRCQNCRGNIDAAQQTRLPDSSSAERIRANGLVNMRIRRGKADRPGCCQHCHKPGRVDAHHPDYKLPHLIVFLCRSCHMKAHRDADFEAEVAAKAKLLEAPQRASAATQVVGGAA